MTYLQFWGKAGGGRTGEPAWHPNAYHSLDVAASAEALLLASPRKLELVARLLGTSPVNARRLIVCLIALHDIGKFASNFQKKVPELPLFGIVVLSENSTQSTCYRFDVGG